MKNLPIVKPTTRRWREQRWLLDAVIESIGPEWDQGRLGSKGRPGGPEGIADFRSAGRRMKRFTDIEREFAAQAARREARARAFEEQGRLVSARESYIIAALLWASARWPIFEVNERVIDYERRMNDCYARFIAYAPHPIERVEIPFGKSSLPAYFHLPRKPAAGERFPCVVMMGGLDGSKENHVQMYGDPMLERGMAVLAVDMPGHPECVPRGLFATADNHAEGAAACVDWLSARSEVDPKKLVVKGSSFGTYWGTTAAAALGKRLCAVAATGICQEPGGETIFETASPSFKMRFMLMSGHSDEGAFDAFMKSFDLRKIAAKIECPYMILAGEEDQLSPIRHTYELFELIGAPKRLVVYEGANHGIRTAPSAANGESRDTILYDWLADRIAGKPMTSEKVYIDRSGKMHAEPY